MKISEFLKSVRANMSPETWIKGSLCKNKDGVDSNYMSNDACAFCLYGYLYRTNYLNCANAKSRVDVSVDEVITPLIIKANPQIPSGKVAAYNDNLATTFEDIVKVIDNTIALAEGRGL